MTRMIGKLTFVTDAPHFGGAERYLVDMARAARRRGIEPHIHWLALPEADDDVFHPERVGETRVTSTSSTDTQSAFGMVRAMRKVIEQERPDGLVINAAGRPRFWLAPWCAKVVGVPAVWVHQMVEGRDHRRLTPRWLGSRMEGPQWWRVPQALRHRLASAAVTHVITLNAEDRERIHRCQHVARDRVRVVPHGVDGERFRPDAQQRLTTRAAWARERDFNAETLLVGTAGRLVSGKRVDLLVEAAALLHARGMELGVVVAGRGPERAALEKLADERSIRSRVLFLDFVEDMPSFHNALDVFVLCSDTESFGLVLAEAMACERPVVATPTAGAARQIRDGHNGFLLRGFGPDELADGLQRLGEDRSLRMCLGRQGRRDVMRDFSIEQTLEQTLRALRSSEPAVKCVRWAGTNGRSGAVAAGEEIA